MKAVIAAPVFPPEVGNVSVYVKRFAKELCKASFGDVVVLAYANTFEEIDGVKIHCIKKSDPLLIRLFLYTVKLFRLSRGADVIYVYNTFASGLPAVVVGGLRGIPVILRFSEDEVSQRASAPRKNNFFTIRLLSFLQKRILKRARAISADGDFLAEVLFLSYEVPKEKIRIDRNPAPKPETLPFPPEFFPHRILFASTAENEARKEELEELENSLRKKIPDAGIFPLDEANISRAEKWHLLRGAGVILFFSCDVGYSLYACALSSGIPAVIFSSKEQAEKTLTDILENPGTRREAIANGNSILKEEYSWEAYVRNFTDFILHLS
ncbi:MAG: glycosyltransferase [Candidatus Paceibacterota bacterium]|jgi:glycosyltransferase involved in cell wall biosynthesis